MKRDVYAKLRAAYAANRGVRLTAEDVDRLMLLDQAVLDVACPDREGMLPDASKPRAKKPSRYNNLHCES